MKNIAFKLLPAAIVALVAGCALPTADNPYPGNGGDFFKYPTAAEIADPRQRFDADVLNMLRPGTSTKRDVVVLLGPPTWWTTSNSGLAQLGYDFHGKGATVEIPEIMPARFVFDAQNLLIDAEFVGSKLAIDHTGETFAFVHVVVDADFKVVDGIVPADWAKANRPGQETVYLGSYVRTPITVLDTIAGNIEGRRHVVMFTISSPRTGRWQAYMLLATDRFGNVRVAYWNDEPYLCESATDPDAPAALKAVLNATRVSPTCRNWLARNRR